MEEKAKTAEQNGADQVENRSVLVQILITPSMAERLDRVADRERRTRTQQAARLVEDGVVANENAQH